GLARASQRVPWRSPTRSQAHSVGYDYLATSRTKTPNPEEANRAIVQRLSPDRQRRWNEALASTDPSAQVTVQIPFGYTASIPSKGCVADAWRRLYGQDLKRWETVRTISNHSRNEVVRRTLADKRYIDAVHSW